MRIAAHGVSTPASVASKRGFAAPLVAGLMSYGEMVDVGRMITAATRLPVIGALVGRSKSFRSMHGAVVITVLLAGAQGTVILDMETR